MKKIAVTIVALACMVAHAEFIKGNPGPNRGGRDPRASKMGGFLEKPQTGKAIFVVNAQKRVSRANIRKAIDLLSKNTHIGFNFIDGDSVTVETAEAAKRKLGAPAAIFVIDDAKMTMPMIIAPESALAIVNVAAMGGESEKQAYIDARTRKEVIRAFLFACGGIDSKFSNNLMASITKVTSLDDYDDAAIPQDAVGRAMKFLISIGVEPNRYVPYEKACVEGWAPPPTNDVQKAIWDKVHAPPEKPLKITYDKDKQKPVVK